MLQCLYCNKEYEVKKNEIDDGFCSFDCWEHANCIESEMLEKALVIEED